MANRKLEGPSVLPMVALVAVLLVQTVVCLDKRVEKEVAKERNSLEFDRMMFKEIRVYSVVNLDCDVRHRRATYKMLKHFEQEREQQIRELLARAEEGLTAPQFQTAMRNIHLEAMKMIEPIAKELAEACRFSKARDWAVDDLLKVLGDFLASRRDSGEEFDARSLNDVSDPWDESEVDLKSDKEPKAIAKAIQDEKDALEEDREQAIKFAGYPYCTNIQRDLLDWDIARTFELRDVLAKRFDSAKALRKAIFDVHSEHLDKLQEYDETLRRGCGERYRAELLNLIEAYFHQRKLNVIKGKTQVLN